jgi:hypothetical protein
MSSSGSALAAAAAWEVARSKALITSPKRAAAARSWYFTCDAWQKRQLWLAKLVVANQREIQSRQHPANVSEQYLACPGE